MAKVLIADDDSQVLRMAVRVFRDAGHLVYPAESAGEAVRIARMHKDELDLIVLDGFHGEGLGAAQRIRGFTPARIVMYSNTPHLKFEGRGLSKEERPQALFQFLS